MNYLEIVLDGYCDNTNRNHLENYFYREFKKAEKEHYEAIEFFDGCMQVADNFTENLMDQLHKQKNKLYQHLQLAQDGKLMYDGVNDIEGIKNRQLESIEYCKNELSQISISNYSISLSRYTNGKYPFILWNSDVEEIREAINQAKIKNNSLLNKKTDNDNDELKKFSSYLKCVDLAYSIIKPIIDNEIIEIESLKQKTLFEAEQLELFDSMKRYIEKYGAELTLPLLKKMSVELEHAGRFLDLNGNINTDPNILIKESLRRLHLSFQLDLANFKALYFPNIKLNANNSEASKEIVTTIKSPVIRRFCELVNDSKVIIKEEDEGVQSFAQRVCKEFNLRYTIRATKHFSINNKPKQSDRNLKKVVELILPNIPSNSREQIQKFINNAINVYG